MKKILFNMLIAVAAVSIFASCTTLTPDGNKAISIETTEFSVPAEGGDIQVKFIPSLAWTATCEESWLTLSPASGDASESEIIMTVTVAPNASSQRIAAIVLSTESGDVNLSVTQEGFDYSKILEQTEYDIPIEGEEIKIKFIPPVDWTAECDAEWVYLSADSGKASKTKKTLTITVDSNEGGNARKAVINLYFGEEEVVVTLRQKGENATTPDNPSGPDNPSDPDNPSNPDNPSDPDDPSTPDDPSDPDYPGDADDDAQAGTEDVNKGEDVGITK